MEKTKTHSSVGASILEKVGFPYPVVPTVKYHHERWDGAGYPEGLSGSSIPLTARILSVADAYDALRIPRSYRPAVPREEACKFINSRAGSQYDPRVVELLLRNLHVFEAEIKAQGVSYEDEESVHGSFTPDTREVYRPTYVDEIKKANHEAFTLFSMARDFGSALSKDETLSLFTEKISEFAPFDTCAVYLFESSDELATAVRVRGRNADLLAGRTVKVGQGATGLVLQQNKPVLGVDPSLDFATSNPELCREYSAMLSVPLIAEERIVGAVSLYSATLSIYQDEHLRLLETISRIGASAIKKSLRHAETETIALTDPMTGLPNARSLQVEFEKEARRADRKNTTFQLLVLDLDGFKAVNDTYGHKVGDRMLREVSGVIRGQLREYDILARYGGDEFVAIVPEADQRHVRDLVDRIEKAVTTFSLDVGEGVFAKVGVSTGAAEYPSAGHTFDQVVASADKAMYLTKASHKRRASEKSRPAAAVVFEERPIDAEMYLPAFGIDAGETHFADEYVVELDESHIIGTVDDAGIVAPLEAGRIIKSKLIN
jgi:diguanylate cyclase (GGDEF)-like protein